MHSLRFLLDKFEETAWQNLRKFKSGEDALNKQGRLDSIIEFKETLNSIIQNENDTPTNRLEQYKPDTPGY